MTDNKIIIIGCAPGWENAPLDRNTWGATKIILKRPVSRVIDMHFMTDMRKLRKDAAIAIGVPYINVENYPLSEIVEFFGTDYFTGTVDYMMALAIYEGATSIDMYGVLMESDTEYWYQKSGVDFWCGQAMGRGIKVTVHGAKSTIMKTPNGLLYGYYTKQKLKGRHGEREFEFPYQKQGT